jgi:hypothetical protein
MASGEADFSGLALAGQDQKGSINGGKAGLE